MRLKRGGQTFFVEDQRTQGIVGHTASVITTPLLLRHKSSPDSFLGERKLSYLQGNQWNNAGIHLETSPVRNVCVREEVACTNGNGSTFVIL